MNFKAALVFSLCFLSAHQPIVWSEERAVENPAINGQAQMQGTPAELQQSAEQPLVSAAVAPLRTEADALLLCEAFMQAVAAGRFEEAFNLIRPYFPVSEARITKIETETKQQLGMAELQFGKSIDHAFTSGEEVHGSVLRYRFLQRYERDAIFWEFVFYKPEGYWLINALGFDDEIRNLFD